MKTLHSIGSIVVSSIALNFCSVAQAVNLVTNGGFVPTVVTTSSILRGPVTLDGWTFSPNVQDTSTTVTGFNFVVPDGTAFSEDINKAYSQPPILKLYGNPGQTVNSQADASGGAASGWYLANDAFYQRGAINQTLTGLTAGEDYTVSFSQASGQLQTNGNLESFNAYFQVGFGNSATMSFTGGQAVSNWQTQSLTFTADSANQVLSFLANADNNVPPFALLSGVSVQSKSSQKIPEPGNYVGTLIGIGFLGTLIKSRLAKNELDERN
jgi:Protein of unknown function (DUF642)